MVEEAYVSFETAKLLKEKGFDEGCIVCWFAMTEAEPILNKNMPRSHYNNKGNNIDIIGCPTQSLAMRWLREVHKIDIVIFHEQLPEDLYWARIDRYPYTEYEQEPIYTVWEESCEAAIKYCLENLI